MFDSSQGHIPRDMANKIALVTGGVRRLGKDISLALAEKGFDIVLNYNGSSPDTVAKTAGEIEKLGVKAYPVKADVSKSDEVTAMFDKVRKVCGSLDVLINNAAVFEGVDFFDITEEFIDKVLGINLKGTLFCSQEGAKLMMKSGADTGREDRKRIINLCSLGGILNWPKFIPYSVSKAGVHKLTKIMARKLAPEILVNGIAPGTIVIEDDPNYTVDPEEVKKYPMKEFGKAKDITSLINYLATENEYITGHIFIVDGGRVLV
jgi:NAD(P)-dependent dehydrogenase (short-subunit alcohol dehydrogenase family)